MHLILGLKYAYLFPGVGNPLKAFVAPIPGQLQGYNIPCTNGLTRFGQCINDHLILDTADECASVCLAVDACMSFEYGIGDRSPVYRYCFLNTIIMDGILGQYGILSGANYYELEQRRCLVDAVEVPGRYVSDSHRLQIDYKDRAGSASSFAATFSCAPTCQPQAEDLEDRLCYSQIPCPSDCVKDRCNCPGADSNEAMASCHELQARGFETGLQTLIVAGELRKVYCDMDTDGGGWTLVGSSAAPLSDHGGPWHSDLTSSSPYERNDWIWSGLRDVYPGQADLRFSCNVSTTASNDADVRFSDVLWYTTLTASEDEGRVCFFAGEPLPGVVTEPAPARHDIVHERDLPWGKRFSSGFLEGENSCRDSQSFSVDFSMGGLSASSGKADATNWGMKNGVAQCGEFSGPEADGVYQVWFRESTAQYSWRRADYEFVDLIGLPGATPQLGLEDDGFFEADLPFAFEFFGASFSTVNVSSNGYVTFSDDKAAYGNTRTIPYRGPPDAVLLVYWTDLNPQDLPSDGPRERVGGGIYTYSRYVGGVLEWICQWRLPFWLGTHGDPFPSSDQMVDFQIVLRADGSIRYSYNQLGEASPSYAVPTVGIEDPSGTSWLSLSRDDPDFLRGSTLKLTPCERGNCPPPNCGCDGHTVCDFVAGRFTQACKACPAGYSGTGSTGCVDLDECDVSENAPVNGLPVCDPLTTCSNSEGSYECSDCPGGYFAQDNQFNGAIDCVLCQPVGGQCLAVTCTNSTDSLCATCQPGDTGAPTMDKSCSSCSCGTDGSPAGPGTPLLGWTNACQDTPRAQGNDCGISESQLNAIEALISNAHPISWSNCDDGQFCRDLSVGTAGRSQRKYTPNPPQVHLQGRLYHTFLCFCVFSGVHSLWSGQLR